VSVVVATRDRPACLERSLTALSWQTAKRLEVVVVDDASAHAGVIRSVVERAVEASNGGHRDALVARIVDGQGRGPAAARNLGARAARGGVVCFTDDDCVPEPRWAECLAAACAGGGAAAAGITIADPVAGRAAAASQLITNALQAASLVGDRLGFAPTCNLACTAEVARALPFDESFPLAAGEDRDWCARLVAAGLPLRFVPEAVVEHRPRMGLVGLLRQQSRYGRGAVRYRSAGRGRKLSGAAFYGRLAREAMAAGPAVAALVVVAQTAVAAGAAMEAAGRGT
jgi:GT2 family glycosyltransferase